MKKAVFSSLLFIILSSCQSLDILHGTDSLTSESASEEVRVVEVKPLSPDTIQVIFDKPDYSQYFTPPSIYLINNEVVVLDAYSSSLTDVILYVSNQQPGIDIRVRISEYYYTNNAIHLSSSSNVTSTNSGEIYKLLSDSFTVGTYGSLDTESPSIDVYYPYDGYIHNIYVQGQYLNVLMNVNDNAGIASVSYKIDSSEEMLAANQSVSSFAIDLQKYGNNNHRLSVIVRDFAGNSASDYVDFELTRDAPSLYAYPLSGYASYENSNDVKFTAYTSDATTTKVILKIHSDNNDYEFSLSGSGNNWSGYYFPAFDDFDKNTLQFIFINASYISNTNITGNIYIYDPSVIYVSAAGNDTNIGTPSRPLKTIQKAIELAQSYPDRDTIRIAEGTYPAFSLSTSFVKRTGFSFVGGYSADFTARDPASYPVNAASFSFAGVSDNNISDMNFTAASTLSTCSGISLNNLKFDSLTRGTTRLTLSACRLCVISNCIFNNAQRGLYLKGTNNAILNSRFTYCIHNGSILERAYLTTIDHCAYMYNAEASGAGMGNYIRLYYADYNIISSCIFASNVSISACEIHIGPGKCNIITNCIFSYNSGPTIGCLHYNGGVSSTLMNTNIACVFHNNNMLNGHVIQIDSATRIFTITNEFYINTIDPWNVKADCFYINNYVH